MMAARARWLVVVEMKRKREVYDLGGEIDNLVTIGYRFWGEEMPKLVSQLHPLGWLGGWLAGAAII